MITIYKREVAFFRSPIAYSVIGFFMVLTGCFLDKQHNYRQYGIFRNSEYNFTISHIPGACHNHEIIG